MGSSHQVGAVDNIWLNMDRPNNLMVVESLMWFDEPVDWQRLEAVIRTRLIDRYPVFSRRAVPATTPLTMPHWEDDPEFALATHLIPVRLPAPGDDACLQAYVEDHMHRPLDRDHALWQMHLIDGYRGGSAVYSRLHHAIADGIALAQVLLSLTDESPTDDLAEMEPGKPQERRRWRLVDSALRFSAPVTGTLSGAAQTAVGLPRALTPGAAVRGLTLARQTVQIVDKLLLSTNPRSPLEGRPGTAKRAVWSQPWAVADVKRIGRLADATVNDVLITAMSGALTDYVVDHGGDPVDMITMVPVNLRPPGIPLPRDLGNRFALVMLPLPTGVRAPLARLSTTKRRMDDIKRSPEAVITFGIINGIGRTAPELAHHVVNFFADKAIGVTTNVAGPFVGRYLAGTRITGVLGWVPGSGRQTVGVCIFSYDRMVRVGFKVDTTVVPDAEKMVHAFEEQMETLLRIAKAA